MSCISSLGISDSCPSLDQSIVSSSLCSQNSDCSDSLNNVLPQAEHTSRRSLPPATQDEPLTTNDPLSSVMPLLPSGLQSHISTSRESVRPSVIIQDQSSTAAKLSRDSLVHLARSQFITARQMQLASFRHDDPPVTPFPSSILSAQANQLGRFSTNILPSGDLSPLSQLSMPSMHL